MADPESPRRQESATQPESELAPYLRFLVAGLVLYGLYVGRELLLPLVLAVLMGFVLLPLVERMRHWGMRRGLAVALVMIVTIGALFEVGVVLTSQTRSLANEWPQYQSTVAGKIRDIRERLRLPTAFAQTVDSLQVVEANSPSGRTIAGEVQPVMIVGTQDSPMVQLRALSRMFLPTVAMIATFLLYLVLILLDPADLRDRVIRLLGRNLHAATEALTEAGQRVSRYLLMQVIVNVTYAIPLALGLVLIGVPGAALWGTAAAVLRFIPYAGAMIAATFPLLLAFAVDPGWSMFFWTLTYILLLELISNNVVEPWLYGASTGLSVMSVIVAATFWTALWGPAGLLLSTPITVCLLVLGRHMEGMRVLNVLLGNTSALDPPVRMYQRLLAADTAGATDIAMEYANPRSALDFYDHIALPVLRTTLQEHARSGNAARRHSVLGGMSVVLANLRGAFPEMATTATSPCHLLCGATAADQLAADMTAHALGTEGIAARITAVPHVSASAVAQLEMGGDETVCLIFLGTDAGRSMAQLVRRLHRRWPTLEILIAAWSDNATFTSEQIQAAGAQGSVSSMSQLVATVSQRIAPQRGAEPGEPGNVDEAARLESIRIHGLLDPARLGDGDREARSIADIFDVRVAQITWVDADQRWTLGDSRPQAQAGADLASRVHPRAGSVHARVIAGNRPLLIHDSSALSADAVLPGAPEQDSPFFAGVPLRDATGRPLGVLSIEGQEARRFSGADMQLLEKLAAEMARRLIQEAHT